jgi:hypothetical protein
MATFGESTRALVTKSWHAARDRADKIGWVVGNAATEAGRYLELAHGDATRAVAILPRRESEAVFWARVASILVAIAAEEREPHLRVVGGSEGL